MKYDLTNEQLAKAKTIHLKKVAVGGYMCHPTWSYKGYEIQQDDCDFGSGPLQVWCDLFDRSFDSIIELKYAIYKLEQEKGIKENVCY